MTTSRTVRAAVLLLLAATALGGCRAAPPAVPSAEPAAVPGAGAASTPPPLAEFAELEASVAAVAGELDQE